MKIGNANITPQPFGWGVFREEGYHNDSDELDVLWTGTTHREEMYRHTSNGISYYLGVIGADVDNSCTIFECRKRGFEVVANPLVFWEMQFCKPAAVRCGDLEKSSDDSYGMLSWGTVPDPLFDQKLRDEPGVFHI